MKTDWFLNLTWSQSFDRYTFSWARKRSLKMMNWFERKWTLSSTWVSSFPSLLWMSFFSVFYEFNQFHLDNYQLNTFFSLPLWTKHKCPSRQIKRGRNWVAPKMKGNSDCFFHRMMKKKKETPVFLFPVPHSCLSCSSTEIIRWQCKTRYNSMWQKHSSVN